MAVPNFLGVFASGAWNGSSPPVDTNGSVGFDIPNNAYIVILANGYVPEAVLPGINIGGLGAFGATPRVSDQEAQIFSRFTAPIAAGTAITITGAWSWVALAFTDVHTSALNNDFPESATTFARGGGGSLACNPVGRARAEGAVVGVVTLDGQAMAGTVTVNGGQGEAAGFDTANSEQHVCKSFYETWAACGTSSLTATTKEGGRARMAALFLGGTDAAACTPYPARPAGFPLTTGCASGPGPGVPTGRWYEYPGGSGDYHPYPGWFDVDFDYLPDGSYLVVACPHACNGYYGKLQTCRFTDAYPPVPGPIITLNDDNVISASITMTPDGNAHVFYRTKTTGHLIRVRTSKDMGATWGTEAVLDPGFSAAEGHAPTRVCYHPKNGFALMLITGATDGSGTFSYLMVLRQDTAGAWEYVARAVPGFSIASFSGIKALSDGRFYRDGVRITLKEDANSTWQVKGAGQWFDEKSGAGLSITSQAWTGDDPETAPWGVFADFPYANGSYWEVYLDDGAGVWARYGRGGFAKRYEGIRGWDSQVTHPGSSSGDVGAQMLKCRKDGRWDFLRADIDGDLRFARTRVMPLSGAAIWEGR